MQAKFPPFDVKNPQAIREQLQKLLPESHFFVYEQVTKIGQEMGISALLVGGIVRDLLLGRQNLDLDFVTLSFSHPLAEQLLVYFEDQPGLTEIKLLKHDAFGTARLDVAFLDGKKLHIDLATARHELYSHPGALPTVDIDPPATLEEDLKRRDFTINALALSPTDGLVDPYGGLEDLRDGWLRVLHPKSFADDPTRMVRGCRFAARFGYKFDPETAKLLREAVTGLGKLTAERRRNELTLILAEDAPDRGMQILNKYDLLSQIHPLLKWDSEVEKDFWWIRDWMAADIGPVRKLLFPKMIAFLATLCAYMLPAQAEKVVLELRYSHEAARIPPQLSRLKHEVLPALTEALPNSQLYALLHVYDLEALEIAAVLAPAKAPLLRHFLDKIATIKPQLGGDYLKELGLKPGKQFKFILDQLRDAVLDGKLVSREAEAEFLQKLVKDTLD